MQHPDMTQVHGHGRTDSYNKLSYHITTKPCNDLSCTVLQHVANTRTPTFTSRISREGPLHSASQQFRVPIRVTESSEAASRSLTPVFN